MPRAKRKQAGHEKTHSGSPKGAAARSSLIAVSPRGEGGPARGDAGGRQVGQRELAEGGRVRCASSWESRKGWGRMQGRTL